MYRICLLLLALGLLTVVLQARDGVFYDSVEDAFEWIWVCCYKPIFCWAIGSGVASVGGYSLFPRLGK
jgi:hypothetical protein